MSPAGLSRRRWMTALHCPFAYASVGRRGRCPIYLQYDVLHGTDRHAKLLRLYADGSAGSISADRVLHDRSCFQVSLDIATLTHYRLLQSSAAAIWRAQRFCYHVFMTSRVRIATPQALPPRRNGRPYSQT